jgi:hypothetical protein
MIELSTIRDLVAIFGVIAGFTYYVMTVRINQRAMRVNLTNSFLQQMSTNEFVKETTELLYMEWEDYDDFERKYGSDVDVDNFNTRIHVWSTYDNLGNLLKTSMADKTLLNNSMTARYAITIWHKFEDVLKMNRKLYGTPNSWSGFECLADEMDKMEQQRNPDRDRKNINPKYTDTRKQQANR